MSKPDPDVLPPFDPIEKWVNIPGIRDEFMRHMRDTVIFDNPDQTVASLMYMTEEPTEWLVDFLYQSKVPTELARALCIMWAGTAGYVFAEACALLERLGGERLALLQKEKLTRNVVLRLNILLQDADKELRDSGLPTLHERIMHHYGLEEWKPKTLKSDE